MRREEPQIAGLKAGDRVIDFGTGFAEPLILWAERFGISGVGIDLRPYACERARQKITQRDLSSRLEIVCGDASEYQFTPHSFEVASCIGATFIWGTFHDAVHAMKGAIVQHGKLVIGEVYWLTDDVPSEFRTQQSEITTELELLQGARQEGFDSSTCYIPVMTIGIATKRITGMVWSDGSMKTHNTRSANR